MNQARVIYHLARADFLERVRRYSFLVMLGLVVSLGYLSATCALVMNVPPNYVGETNGLGHSGALRSVEIHKQIVGFLKS